MGFAEGETTWNSGVPVGFDMRDVCEAPGTVEDVCEIGWNSGVVENVEREVEFFLKSTMSVYGASLRQEQGRTNCSILAWARTRLAVKRIICGKNSCIFFLFSLHLMAQRNAAV